MLHRTKIRRTYLVLSLLVSIAYYIFHIYVIRDPSNFVQFYTSARTIEHYVGFDFHRENWTVQMRTERPLNVVSERLLNSLIQTERVVKRIIYTNGSERNLGCRNTTKECAETMYFDYQHNIRMNTPPCCRKHLLSILEHTGEELRRLKVDHFLAYGGVIGWYRSGEMIPYDGDLDMLVDIRFWFSPLMGKVLERLTALYGHQAEFKQNGYKLRIVLSKTNKLFLDLWPYKIGIIHRQSLSQWMVYVPLLSIEGYHPVKDIFPLRNVTFSGVQTYIPNNPSAYLHALHPNVNLTRELSCQLVINGKCTQYPTILYKLFGLY